MYSNILDKADPFDLIPNSARERELRDLVGHVSSRSHLYADPASIIIILRIPSENKALEKQQ
jgi:hypothetical protein